MADDSKSAAKPTPTKPKAKPKAKAKRKVRRYSDDFRQRVIDECRAGRMQGEVAKQYGLSHGQVSTWLATARAAAPPATSPPLLPPAPARATVSDELRLLQARLAVLEAERDRLRRVITTLLE